MSAPEKGGGTVEAEAEAELTRLGLRPRTSLQSRVDRRAPEWMEKIDQAINISVIEDIICYSNLKSKSLVNEH